MSTTTINFRIDEQSKGELQGIAEQHGLKVSSLVREIITSYLEDYKISSQVPHVVYLDIPESYNHLQ